MMVRAADAIVKIVKLCSHHLLSNPLPLLSVRKAKMEHEIRLDAGSSSSLTTVEENTNNQ